MDNWRQEKKATVTKALKLVQKRTEALTVESKSSSGKDKKKLMDELTKLQEVTDQLLDFQGKMFIYSYKVYARALQDWEKGVETFWFTRTTVVVRVRRLIQSSAFCVKECINSSVRKLIYHLC